jgi:hypothetical protein
MAVAFHSAEPGIHKTTSKNMRETALDNLHMWIGIKKHMIRVPEEFRSPCFLQFLDEIDCYIQELTTYLTN